MKIVQTIVKPIPDSDGYHILQCSECKHFFLLNPIDFPKEGILYCPFCGYQGNILTFANFISEKIINENQLITEENNEILDIEDIKKIIEDYHPEDMDVNVIDYEIDEFVDSNLLFKYEFICCDKTIKIPVDHVHSVKYCSFCKGEILLYHNE